jgi:hypothetical protein
LRYEKRHSFVKYGRRERPDGFVQVEIREGRERIPERIIGELRRSFPAFEWQLNKVFNIWDIDATMRSSR